MILKVVSIGPGDPSLINFVTEKTIRSAGMLILRTGQHPLTSWLKKQDISFRTMDDLYESSDDFEMLAETIASRLWYLASRFENTVYAVSDTMTDHTVDAVISCCPKNALIQLVPGFSFADYYLPVCRPFFSTVDIQICPAASFQASGYNPSRPVLITELNDEITAGKIKQILSSFVHDDESVFFLNGKAEVIPVPIYEIDRQPQYDHLSAVSAGPFSYAQRTRKTLEDLMLIMERLRSEEGCPWDRAQTHETLKPYVVEEAWEVIGAIQENQPDHLAEELGDLLFQVVFHTSIGKSFDEFTMDDVLYSICEKMIRRHPHVFGKTESGNIRDRFSAESWDQIKELETGSHSPVEALRDISASLPSLRYAEKVIRKLKRIPGIPDPSFDEIVSMIRDSASEATPESLATLLFFCTYLAQSMEVDSEVLLHQYMQNIIQSCQALEKEGKISLNSPNPLTFNDLGVY